MNLESLKQRYIAAAMAGLASPIGDGLQYAAIITQTSVSGSSWQRRSIAGLVMI